MSSGTYTNIPNGTPGSQGTLSQNDLGNAEKENASKVSDITDSVKMPNYANAVTPMDKFTKYSLNYDNPNAKGKAEAYEKGLGYTKDNASGLISQIHNYVTSGASAYEESASEYGTKYKFRIPVKGPNGKTKNVIAVYQVDKGSSTPRLITNYLEGK